MRARRFVPLLVATLAVHAAAGRASAGEDATAAAYARAAAVRAAIPAPIDPEEGKPGLDFKFEGDVMQAGENAGSVTYRIDIGTFRDEPVWLVNEEFVDEFGGSRTVTESTLYLKPDLSLLKGEWRRTLSDQVVRLTFKRDGDGFEVQRSVARGSEEPVESKKRVPAPPDATFGRAALLLFLRHAPATATDYLLPMVNLEAAIPAVNEHEAPAASEPLRIEVLGGAKYGEGKSAREAWMVKLSRSGTSSEAYFTPKTHELLAIDSIRPPEIRTVPKGQGGAKPVYEDDKPATTWKAAYLKFGHGYHLAVVKWLDAAIHWDTMYRHEIESGSLTKETKLEDFKRAFIAEFLRTSKHRPRTQADSILLAALQTSEIRNEKDGTVRILTSPEFGGNIFHFQAIDGIWYITRIDQ
jgi:hypothetical protein